MFKIFTNKTKTLTLIILLIIGISFISSEVNAAIPYLEKVPWNSSGGSVKGSDFSTYVTGLYKFLLAGVVISALLMVTIGGFMYLTSAGNQAQAGTAKKVITDALLGLVIVFCTWLILNTINPDLLQTNNGPDNTLERVNNVYGGDGTD